jgi:hypothetical protein
MCQTQPKQIGGGGGGSELESSVQAKLVNNTSLMTVKLSYMR